ncbi:TPA: hypothetical protein ACVO4S_004825, partial [Vibrio diabolicus]
FRQPSVKLTKEIKDAKAFIKRIIYQEIFSLFFHRINYVTTHSRTALNQNTEIKKQPEGCS